MSTSIPTMPIGDEFVLSPSIMGKYGRPDISLHTLTYTDAIAMMALLASEICAHPVDFTLDDEDLQAAVAITRVDAGTLILYAMDRYRAEHGASISDITTLDYLRPYWKKSRFEMAFGIYHDCSHARLQDLVNKVTSCMFPDYAPLKGDDALWVMSRFNDALMRKFASTSSTEILDLAAHRIALITFYAEQFAVIVDAIENAVPLYGTDTSTLLRDEESLSLRARVLHNLLTVLSVTA